MKVSAVVAATVLCLSAAGASAQAINDAQIAHIVVTANQVDIDAGKLAASMGTNPEVKKVGQQMVTDHTGRQQAGHRSCGEAEGDAGRQSDQPEPESGEKNVASLKSLTDAAFDRAYIDNEVGYHQAVLDAVDKTLIPGATNAELKALLVKVRPAFVAHLEHAKKLQSSLGR
jgi:putative membrane protein